MPLELCSPLNKRGNLGGRHVDHTLSSVKIVALRDLLELGYFFFFFTKYPSTRIPQKYCQGDAHAWTVFSASQHFLHVESAREPSYCGMRPGHAQGLAARDFPRDIRHAQPSRVASGAEGLRAIAARGASFPVARSH